MFRVLDNIALYVCFRTKSLLSPTKHLIDFLTSFETPPNTSNDDVVPRTFISWILQLEFSSEWTKLSHFLLRLHVSIFHPRVPHLDHDYFFLYFINDLRVDAICSNSYLLGKQRYILQSFEFFVHVYWLWTDSFIPRVLLSC